MKRLTDLRQSLFNFNPEAAAAAKEGGMEAVDAGANPDWSATMELIGLEVARELTFFTSDDVFFRAIEKGVEMGATKDLRAFGPVMFRLAKRGVCTKADCRPRNSLRATLHGSPRTVWRSLVCEVS